MAKRIISLVPSQTELLYDLGLNDEVVGITKFCIHPGEWFRNKTRVGGTKTLNIELIKSLQPDLILANKEENVKEQVEALGSIADVYTSDISNLEEALKMIGNIGLLVGKTGKADEMIAEVKAGFVNLQSTIQHLNLLTIPRTAYLIWKNPYMAAGGDTFINDMLERCGFENAFKPFARYPEVVIDQLIACDLLFLSSEPYPFKQKHIDELQQHLRGTKILLVDGEMFSWYGSRLLIAVEYFRDLITSVHSSN